MSDNKNEHTRRSTFWFSFGKVFCINRCTKDLMDDNLDDNSSAIAMLPIDESETETVSQEKSHRRFAIGPNLPIFFNCLRRRETAAQQREDANTIRLGNRLRNYDDDSESPLCLHKEDNNVSELCSAQCQYLCGDLTRQRQQATMKPVAGPSNEKKLAKHQNLRVTFASPEQFFDNSEKKSPSFDSSTGSD